MTDSELGQLRVIFERTHSCTMKFRRSRLGNYVNPSTSLRWREFLAGAEAVLTGELNECPD